MTIAELFVKIGVAGAEGVTKSLGRVQTSLGGLLDSSLATKAGILGVIAGLERLTGFASQVGMDLTKFNMTTGLSTAALQNWQYMGQKFDVTGQEMASTITGLQTTMTDMMLGKGMPEGAAALGIKMTRDPYNLMEQLTKKAKELPPDVARNLIKSFGISDNVFQMMRSVNLEMDKIKGKDIISTKEIKKLTDINKAWKDMWFGMRTMGIKIVAKEGLGAVEELGNAFRLLADAGKYVFDLVEKFKPLKFILIAIAGIVALMFSPFTAAIAAATALIAILSDIQKFREGKASVIGDISTSIKEKGVGGALMSGAQKVGSGAKDLWTMMTGAAPPKAKEASQEGERSPLVGKVPAVDPSNIVPMQPKPMYGPQNKGDVNMNNTFHIDGSHSPHETGKEVQKAINKAGRQYHTLAGGSNRCLIYQISSLVPRQSPISFWSILRTIKGSQLKAQRL